ncbi:DUF5776 domain-containing protein [Lentilactobacillus dabitei]|uniref:DUF5776 domain-containing protein n=1 Tax=Lentilactobacillus dabitei TaxID=2831523 RepID=UPI001C3FDE00|nr:DUF5776 domain-containing protein [Lentilactobacillus dabitei]
MPDKSLQAIVVNELSLDGVQVDGENVTSPDQISKKLLEDNLTGINYATTDDNQTDNEDIFNAILSVKSLTGLEYAKNSSYISLNASYSAFTKYNVPVRRGELSDIDALKDLKNLSGVDFQRNQIHDISALANKTFNTLDTSFTGLYGNRVTDASPWGRSNFVDSSGDSLNSQIYVLPNIKLNPKMKSYTMTSFAINSEVKNIVGENIPIVPYYVGKIPQTSFASDYNSTADGTANTSAKTVTWTNLNKDGDGKGTLTVYYNDTLLGNTPYDGVIVQPYTLDDTVGNINVIYKDEGGTVLGSSTISGTENDLWNYAIGSDGLTLADPDTSDNSKDVNETLQQLEATNGYKGVTADGPKDSNGQQNAKYSVADTAAGLPTVTYTFSKTTPVQNISFNVKYVDSDNKPLTINGKTQETLTDKSETAWNYTIPTVSGYTFDHFATSGTAPTLANGKLSGTYGPNSKDITLVYKKNIPTPPTPPEPNPTPVNPINPVNPTPNPAPTPSTPTVTTQPATPGIAKKGEAVYALKKIYMYSNKDFRQSGRVASYAKKPRSNRPMFVVTDYATSKAGNLRYVVRDVNHHSKTAGKKGYITADYAYVRPVYYHSSHKTLTVINPRGVNEYTNKNLTGRVKNFKQGTQLKVKGFVKHNLTTRYLLSNGHYITGNRKLVIAGNQKQPKQIKVKKAIYHYNNANFSKRTKHIKQGTVLKVKRWEYSHSYSTTTFGAKRYAVTGGYVTANSHYVKVIK